MPLAVRSSKIIVQEFKNCFCGTIHSSVVEKVIFLKAKVKHKPLRVMSNSVEIEKLKSQVHAPNYSIQIIIKQPIIYC